MLHAALYPNTHSLFHSSTERHQWKFRQFLSVLCMFLRGRGRFWEKSQYYYKGRNSIFPIPWMVFPKHPRIKPWPCFWTLKWDPAMYQGRRKKMGKQRNGQNHMLKEKRSLAGKVLFSFQIKNKTGIATVLSDNWSQWRRISCSCSIDPQMSRKPPTKVLTVARETQCSPSIQTAQGLKSTRSLLPQPP